MSTAIGQGLDLTFGDEIVQALLDRGIAFADDGAEASALVINRSVALGEPKAFEDIGDEDFGAALDHSVVDLLEIVQANLPRLTDGASIVAVTSRAHLGAWHAAQHAAASAALVALCRTMSLEFAPRGIRVNVVVSDFAETYQDNPAGRTQVAEMVAWLASPQSAGVNGEAIVVDQGRALQMREARKR